MCGITVKGDEGIDKALKRLKNKLDSEGILEEIRRRRSFESTIVRNRRKAKSAPKRYKARWNYEAPAKKDA